VRKLGILHNRVSEGYGHSARDMVPSLIRIAGWEDFSGVGNDMTPLSSSVLLGV
jgi:hypothetical protein